MKHECKITVLDTKCFEEYQEEYLANPNSGPCPLQNHIFTGRINDENAGI